MQYLLNEEEYSALQTAVVVANIEKKRILDELCTLIACTKPVVTWMNDGKPTPWGCPHAACICNDDGEYEDFGTCPVEGCMCHAYIEYCDHCPVDKRCLQRKRYSK